MNKKSRVFASAITFLICVTSIGAVRSPMELVEVSRDGRGFVEQGSGRPYIPFGTNYYDPHTGWAPKLWRQFDADKVREHFRVMSSLGVNCARVFLTAGSFQPTADAIDEQTLSKLDKMVEIAREVGIRLIPTGPDHWEGQPGYWKPDRFAGEDALGALDRFWDVFGRRYRGEPAIFAWDLLNEPHLPWSCPQWAPKWHAWLHEMYADRSELKAAWGDELTEADTWDHVAVPADRPNAGNPRLRDWQRFREHLADEWVRRQVEAIRRADPTHLVTVGYIQWSYPLIRPGDPGRYAAFNPHRQVRWLDFTTIHFYPTQGSPFQSDENWRNNISYLQAVVAYNRADKPVLLGEYGWYGGGAPQKHPFLSEEQQAHWIGEEVVATRSLADGWLSWPFADTPSSGDISLYAGLVKLDLSVKAWGRKFQELAADLVELKLPAVQLPVPELSEALTADQDYLKQAHQAYVEAIGRAMAKP